MMKIIPITLNEANKFVKKFHRHNSPTTGCKFCIGALNDNKLIGVAIAGRPVARFLDNGKTLEILRVCTDGTKNANSFLYSRVRRIGQLMGYEKIITYTLKEEAQSSLFATGAVIEDNNIKPQEWNKSRLRKSQEVYKLEKIRWKL